MPVRAQVDAAPTYAGTAFACLLPAQRAALARAEISRSYDVGQPIYYEGTPALAVFRVHSGYVKLWRSGHAGDQHVIAMRGPGALLGYRAVLAGKTFTVTGEPIERTVAGTISREVFLDFVSENHDFARHLLETVSRQTIETEDWLLARAVDSVVKRTAGVLLSLHERRTGQRPSPCLRQPQRREDLARLIGVAPETLSRTLHALAGRGILHISKEGIRVLDPEKLRQLAG